jgi:glutathione S-transferase
MEKGLSEKTEMLVYNPWEDPPELRQHNPLAQVPVLVTDDGMALYDSRVICEYMDSLGNDGPRLIPQDGARRWQTLRTMALGDGITENVVMMFLEQKRTHRSDEMVERWQGKVELGISAMAGQLADLPPELSMEHIAIACALGYVCFRAPHINWRPGHVELASWYDDFCTRASMLATRPPES